MNPFQLTGMSFLLFYLLTGIAIVLMLRTWIRQHETPHVSPPPNMTDPYAIAFLRAGKNEALRVATVALLDRGLLLNDAGTLKTRNDQAVDLAQRPIEKAILSRYRDSGEAHRIFSDAGALSACKAYERVLAGHGLLADGEVYGRRFFAAFLALAALVGITWIKIDIALSAGRQNIGFLIFLTIIFSIIVFTIWRSRLTGRGKAMLADLRKLFSRLESRATSLRAGGRTNEAALLAAVFGLAALPLASFPFMEKLYPSKSDSGSGCGSSGGSCGSSCGGGCGGGGCGG